MKFIASLVLLFFCLLNVNVSHASDTYLGKVIAVKRTFNVTKNDCKNFGSIRHGQCVVRFIAGNPDREFFAKKPSFSYYNVKDFSYEYFGKITPTLTGYEMTCTKRVNDETDIECRDYEIHRALELMRPRTFNFTVFQIQ